MQGQGVDIAAAFFNRMNHDTQKIDPDAGRRGLGGGRHLGHLQHLLTELAGPPSPDWRGKHPYAEARTRDRAALSCTGQRSALLASHRTKQTRNLSASLTLLTLSATHNTLL